MIKFYKKTIYKKKQKKSFLRKKWFWDLVLMVVFLASLSWLLLKTPYFEIEEIEIVAAEEFKGKIKEFSLEEKNFFLFSSQEISQKTKKQFPKIKELKIKKTFPNKIFIEAKERKKIGIFCFKDQLTCFLISDDGVIFQEAESIKDLIVFTMPEEKKPPAMGSRIMPKAKFSETLLFLKEIGSTNLVVSRVEIFPFEIKLFLKNNFQIYLARNASFKNQAVTFLNLYQNSISEEEKKHLEYIDLRYLEDGKKGQVYWK